MKKLPVLSLFLTFLILQPISSVSSRADPLVIISSNTQYCLKRTLGPPILFQCIVQTTFLDKGTNSIIDCSIGIYANYIGGAKSRHVEENDSVAIPNSYCVKQPSPFPVPFRAGQIFRGVPSSYTIPVTAGQMQASVFWQMDVSSANIRLCMTPYGGGVVWDTYCIKGLIPPP